MFNLLNSRKEVDHAMVLDLFAGTGSMGFEFASRGAEKVICVDIALQSFKYIQRFAREKGMDEVWVIKSEALRYLRNAGRKFDIIFADPPYDMKDIDKIVTTVFDHEVLESDGLLIVEHSKQTDLTELDNFVEHRNYGKVNFSFFEAGNRNS